MGVVSSAPDFEKNFNKPDAWSITEVQELRRVWTADLFQTFGLRKDQVAVLFTKCAFAKGKDFGPLVRDCWAKFNPDNGPLIDALGLLSTFAVMCASVMDAKIEFIFHLFDFNDNGTMSQDELAILVMATLVGAMRYFRPEARLPSDDTCEGIASTVFASFEKDAGEGTISIEEFRRFVKSHLDAGVSIQGFLDYFSSAAVSAGAPGLDAKRRRRGSSDEEAPGGGGGADAVVTDSDIERDKPVPEAARSHAADPDGDGFAVEAEGTGDQFMAVKPWIGAIKEPSRVPPLRNSRPDAELSLEWVHGYRAFDTRNNVRVLANGEYVWHTAAVGIVYNKEKHEQRQYFGHNDDIVALAAHPDGSIVATGQMGKRPVIHVWYADKPECEQAIVVLKAKTLQRACTNLAFSPDGKMLAAVGLDDDHTLTVFLDWEKRSDAVATTDTSKNKVLDVAFGDGGRIMVVGVEYVAVCTLAGGKLEKKKALFGSQKVQAVLSACFFNGKFVTGATSGKLWVWGGTSIETVVKEGHASSVNAVTPVGDVLLSGGKDGKVIVFNKAFAKTAVIDVNAAAGLSSTGANVRAVCCAPGPANIVVGTMAGDVLVYATPASPAVVVHESHCYGELWGLAMHPDPRSKLYATAGDDAFVRVWDRDAHRCVARKRFDTYIRCLTYSPDGKLIACGTGGRLGGIIPKINGALMVLDAATLAVVHMGQDAKRWNQDIKWSPDGRTIALGCHDQTMRLYDAAAGSPKRFAERAVCRGHSSYISHIDFTADSRSIHTNCGAYELLFWNAENGKQDPGGASGLRDAEWATWTAILGWPVQGIWPAAADGTDINSVDRSASGSLLATADDFGKVKVFNYPCTKPGWMCAEYDGHSSHVTNVRFSRDDRHVVSVGGNDKSVFQWAVDGADIAAEDAPAAAAGAADEDDEEMLLAAGTKPVVPAGGAAAAAGGGGGDADPFAVEAEGTGDQFMAVKPWIGAIKAPSKVPKDDKTAPSVSLELQWAYGYQAQAMRNSLRYTASGKIVYTTAALGVVYDPAENTQAFFQGRHQDDIISLAMTNNGALIATGDQGKRPVVFVWDVETRAVKWELKGHKRGVPQVAFSNNGKMLATVGLDDEHTIIVYDVTNGSVVCKQKGDTNLIMGIGWAADDAQFCTVGVKHVYFWEPSSRGLTGKRALFGKDSNPQTYLVVAFDAGGNAIIGCNDGSIAVFSSGRSLIKVVKAAHTGTISAIWYDSTSRNVFTGAKDGVVKRWSAGCAGAEKTWTVAGSGVRSIHTRGSSMLVGTMHSEVVEVRGDAEPVVLQEGHYYGELWGLATHPSKNFVATAGDDGTLRVWDIRTHRHLRKVNLPTLARGACYSPDGTKIAVCLGGRLGGKEAGPEGALMVFDAETLEKLHEAMDAKAWSQAIMWSPDGNTIALGSHDDKVYLYNVADRYKLRAVCKGHSSYITHIDFTADSRSIHTNCGAYELLFWNAENGKQDPGGASGLRDAEWATWTATLGWPVQGIWPPAADGTDVKGVDRSHDQKLLATGDDFGKVKLFRYPTVTPGAGSNEFAGHSSQVTCVRFTHDDDFVLSTGGNDRALLQWDNPANEPEVIEVDDADLAAEAHLVERPEGHSEGRSGLSFEVEDEATGDQFMAVKPWIGAIKAPSAPKVAPNDPPLADLDLEWVHGYRGFDSRSNLYYLASGEIVYHTAALGIVYDSDKHTQRFFKNHTDDIVSLDVHPNGATVATGQMGKDPSIFVWDAVSLAVLKEIKGFHQRAVNIVKFNAEGNLLLSIGQDDNHSLAVYDWKAVPAGRPKRGTAPAGAKTCKVHQDMVLDAAWSPSGTEILAAGVKAIKLISVDSMAVGSVSMAEGTGKLQPFMAVAYFSGEAVVGTFIGALYVVRGKSVSRSIAAHAAPVNTLFVTSDKKLLISGAKNGEVKVWNASYAVTATFSVAAAAFGSVMPNVRSIARHGDGTFLVGTMGSEIYQVSPDGRTPTLHVEGHYYGELWGLATHPSKRFYATAGDDGWVRVWSAVERKCKAKAKLSTLARAVCYSPDGTKIAVCLGGRLGGKEEGPEGQWHVLNAETLAIEHTANDAKAWIQDVKWSPDGNTIAVGSHDAKVYLYNVADKYKLRAVCKGHSSYITHIDFTADSRSIHTNCGAYELLFWNVENGKQDPGGASGLRDAEWATWTATLGWPVQGIWAPAADGTDVKGVDRSHTGTVLATGDDFGLVKLFTFPNTKAGWEFKKFMGHSSQVTSVRFTADDAWLLSAGGNDKAAFQWRTSKMGSALPPVDLASVVDVPPDAEAVDPFAVEEEGAGDQFMAVKPWLGAIKAPSAPPADNPAPPKANLRLDWVYGYQAQLMRNSLVYVQDPVTVATGKSDVAFGAAAVLVGYDSDKHAQRHFRNSGSTIGCTDDITALAVDGAGKYVAVGERGKRPVICVVDSTKMTGAVVLKGHRAGVAALAFSGSGALLASAGSDDAHTVIVFEWRAGTIMFTGKGGPDLIKHVCWAPGDARFITTGVKHIYFWEQKDRAFNKVRGILGDASLMQTFLGAAFKDAGSAVVAAADGQLLLFSGTSLSKAIRAHEGAVNAIWQGVGHIVTGGADGKVKVWDSKSMTVAREVAVGSGGIRSVCSEPGQPLLVGTNESEAYKVEDDGTMTCLFEGHFAAWSHVGELWGLAVHPTLQRVATCGDDRTVRVWDTTGHRQLLKARLDGLMRAVSYSPDGSQLAVGFGGRLGGKESGLAGSFKILDAETLAVVATVALKSGKDVSDIKWSPDGRTLAVGGHDTLVSLYTVPGFALRAVCKGHSSYITHIDFTADSRSIHTNCGAYELLFWNAENGRQDPGGASGLRDAEWATWTATLGWPVQGIWPAAADGTDINSVDRSASGSLLATADDFGKVKVFNYPCVKPGAGFKSHDGHSSHVTNVRFSRDDRQVVSVGGNDRCLFQWSLC